MKEPVIDGVPFSACPKEYLIDVVNGFTDFTPTEDVPDEGNIDKAIAARMLRDML